MSTPFYLKPFYRLLALMLYMDVVRLPCNTDYWNNDNIWPYHPIMHEIRISQDRFAFMWRYFHI